MATRHGYRMAGFLLGTAVLLGSPPDARAVSPGFTYQGQVLQAGVPVTGPCDVAVGLHTAGSGGTQLGVTQTVLAVAVSGGVFTVLLNAADEFGPGAFDGADRYLELAVRCPAGSGSYVVLAPRQAVTATPYALHAMTVAPGAVASSSIADGTIATVDLADQAVTSAKIADGTVTAADVAFPYAGSTSAGGPASDLACTDCVTPDEVSAAGSTAGQVLTSDGSSVAWQALTGLTLPYSGTAATSASVVRVENTGSGFALAGISDQGVGVGAYSDQNHGVFAASNNGYGLFAQTNNGLNGVYGTSSRGDGRGVYGVAAGVSGTGVYGEVTDSAIQGVGVRGKSVGGIGVEAKSDYSYGLWAESVGGDGVYAQSTNGTAVYGVTFNGAKGVHGFASRSDGVGVHGAVTGATAIGVRGDSNQYIGVYGESANGAAVRGDSATGTAVRALAGQGRAVFATTDFGDTGVYGQTGADYGRGVYGAATGEGGWGVVGESGAGASSVGVYGGSSQGIGVFGVGVEGAGLNGSSHSGIGAGGTSFLGNGLVGSSHTNFGLWAGGGLGGAYLYNLNNNYSASLALSSYAADFIGPVRVQGAFSASSKMFEIDHPLDPDGQYLRHASVESPEMANLYSGNVMLDDKGEAWVELPGWFEALNTDFRYQLTPIGGAAPRLHVAEKIDANRFKIGGGPGGLEVSWQVMGTRHDTFALAHPLEVEGEKPVAESTEIPPATSP